MTSYLIFHFKLTHWSFFIFKEILCQDKKKKKEETSNGQKNKYNENETMVSVLVQILLPAKCSK